MKEKKSKTKQKEKIRYFKSYDGLEYNKKEFGEKVTFGELIYSLYEGFLSFFILGGGRGKQGRVRVWTPHFWSCVFHSMTSLIFILFGENLILEKRLGVATYFCFIFKG